MEGKEPTKTADVTEEFDENTEQETDSAPEAESFEESYRIATEELRKKSQDGGENQENQAEEAPAEPVKPTDSVETAKGKEPAKGEDPEPEIDEDLIPPRRLKDPEKEAFKKIPQKWVRRFLNRTVRELESTATRENQAYSAKVKDADAIVSALAPFRDDWAARGITQSQGVLELAGFWAEVSNPKTRKAAISKLRAAFPVSDGGDDDADSTHVSNDPRINKLEAEISRLTQQINSGTEQSRQAQNQKIQDAADRITRELESVQYEMDANGGYVYGDLQKREFLDQWKPRVSALIGTIYGENYRQAGINAYRMLKGMTPLASNQLNQPGLPKSNNQSNQRAVEAAGSLRGRSIPSAIPDAEIEFARPGESWEDSWRLANKRGR